MIQKYLESLKQSTPRKQVRMVGMLLLVLGLVFYGNSLGNRYAIDDEYVTNTAPEEGKYQTNELVAKGFAGIGEIWTTPYIKTVDQSFEYRPVVITTFAIEYGLFGQNPTISHLVNLLLYVLNCLLVFILIRRLFPDISLLFPLFVSLLFLIHPLHSEVVNNLKSRDELLVFVGGFTALIAYLKYLDEKKIKHIIVVIVALALAFLTKKTTIIFAGIIPLALLYKKPKQWKTVLSALGFLFVGYLLFRLVKRGAMQEASDRLVRYYENPLFFADGFTDRLPTAGYTVWWYFKQMLFPYDLVSYYGFNAIPIPGWSNPFVWIGVLIHGGLAGLAIKLWKRRHPIALGILIYLGAVFMYSNILGPAVGIVADRFAYVASFGACLVLGWVLWYATEKLNSKDVKLKLVMALFGIVTIASAAQVINRNGDWENRISLFAADVETAPESAKLHNLLANALTDYDSPYKYKADSLLTRNRQQATAFQQAGKTGFVPQGSTPEMSAIEDLKIYHLRRAVEIFPEYKTPLNNLGAAYLDYHADYDSAATYFQKALALDSSFTQAGYNLAVCYRRLGRVGEAASAFDEVLAQNQSFIKGYQEYTQMYIDNKQFDNAVLILERWQNADPTTGNKYNAVVDAYMSSGDFDLAISVAEAVRKYAPDHRAIYPKLLKLYHNTQQPEKAIEVGNVAIAQNPNDLETLKLLSQLYMQYERYDEALNLNISAAQANPTQQVFAMTAGDINLNVKGDINQAIVWYDMAHNANPTDKKLLQYIIRICQENGLSARAQYYTEKLQKL